MLVSLSIADVLARTSNGGFDFSMFVVSLLALSLATISAAKGYEIINRRRPVDPAVEIQTEEITELKETIKKLERCCGDVGDKKASLLADNTELKDQLNKIIFDLGEVSRAEQMLRKSNISLSRELERLASEPKIQLISARTKAKRKSPSKKRGEKTK